jgi:hypothetical protein
VVMASSVGDQGRRIGETAALGCRAMPRAVVGEILPVTSRGRACARGDLLTRQALRRCFNVVARVRARADLF